MFQHRILQKSIKITMFFVLLSCSAICQTKVGTTAAHSLLWQNSPRSKALGGCSITLIDAQSQHFNPAAMAVFALDNIFGFNISNKTNVIPDNNNVEFHMRSIGAVVRLWPYRHNVLNDMPKYAVSFGYSYYDVPYKHYFTDYSYWNGPGYDPNQEFHMTDIWHTLTGALAFKKGKVTLGIGYAYKKVKENTSFLNLEGNCYDLGMLLNFNAYNTSKKTIENKKTGTSVELSGAFVRSNVGSMKYINQIYDFPIANLLGFSALIDHYGGNSINLSFRPTFQYEIFNEDYRSDIKRLGLEIGYNKAIFGRVGYTIDESSVEDYESFGFGLSLKGLYNNILYPNRNSSDTRNLLSHLDIRFDFARSKLVFFSKTNFYHISISI